MLKFIKKYSKALLLMALVITLSLSALGTVLAHEGKDFIGKSMITSEIGEETEEEVKGNIASVDIALGQLTVKLSGGDSLTFKITPATQIKVNDDKVTLADLKIDSPVKVEFNENTMEALEVKVSTIAKVKGVIKSVDAAAGTVAITVEDGKEVTVKVVSTTRIDINGHGRLFGLLGLSPGMTVRVEYDQVSGQALRIKAKADRERAENRGEGKQENESHSGKSRNSGRG